MGLQNRQVNGDIDPYLFRMQHPRIRETLFRMIQWRAEEPPAMFTHRLRVHIRGNGLGSLEVAVRLDFLHFQQIRWK
jgi:hypothetical protein